MKSGLREKIAGSSTVTNIKALLERGKSFRYAIQRTRNAWVNTARRRIQELRGSDS